MPYDGIPSARFASVEDQTRLNEMTTIRTIEQLEVYSNEVSPTHAAALDTMISTFTKAATGQLLGTTVIDLPTGMGKSTAMVAWVQTAHELDLLRGGVVIAVEKIEAQKDIYDALTRGQNAIPTADIGVWNGGQNETIKPTCASVGISGYQEFRVLIITHARLRCMGADVKQIYYEGRPRNVLLHDEALSPFDVQHLSLSRLLGQLASLKTMNDLPPTTCTAIDHLVDALEAPVSNGSGNHMQTNITSRLGKADLDVVMEAAKSIQTTSMGAVIGFCTGSDGSWDYVNTPASGELQHTLARMIWKMPDRLPPMVVLDASYPIYLGGLKDVFGPGAKDKYVTRHIPLSGRTVGHPIKRYDDVNIALMATGRSGRKWAESEAITSEQGAGPLIREAHDYILNIPADEAILVWIFKNRDGSTDGIEKKLKALLELSEVDTEQTIEHHGKQKRRIVFATHGNEAASNNMSHCSNILFLGTLEKPKNVIAAEALYRTGAERFATKGAADSLIRHDIATNVFQAMSRGALRHTRVDSGGRVQAMTTNNTIITRHSRQLETILSGHLPGVKWLRTSPVYLNDNSGAVVDRLVVALTEVLHELPMDLVKISMTKLKSLLGNQAGDFSPMSFTRAIKVLCSRIPWRKQQRSLVRV